MTDPTSDADGIEAAARVAEAPIAELEEQHRQWREAFGEQCSQPHDAEIFTRSEIAKQIRALAKADRVFASAPGGESGWRWVPIEPTPDMLSAASADEDGWRRMPKPYARYLLHWQAMLGAAPAPPGAPPVSAPPAESGQFSRVPLIRAEEIKVAEARIRELEGEVEDWRGRLATECGNTLAARYERDRLTTAAQAARDALEPLSMLASGLDNGRLLFGGGHLIPDDETLMTGAQGEPQIRMGDLRRAREALASLVAVLPALAKEEGSASQERGNG